MARTWILVGIIAVMLPDMAAAAAANDGYLVDTAGSVVRSGFGKCWHTGYWTSAMAVEGCDAVAAKPEVVLPPKAAEAHPSPSPPPAPVPEKMPLIKLDFSASAHFDFDESTLKPEGRTMLDGLVRELGGATYEVIHVIGHADRIGSADYNMGLSLRRAEEVKSYLVNKGIPAERITTEGRGEAQPLTKPGDCRGMSSGRAIACLQLDRRAEVTVVGGKRAAK